MEYCTTCIMPSTRPGLILDKNGVCGACRWHMQKIEINWDARLNELKEIADWAKSVTSAPWDCILGVSGGKDSTWQAMFLREKLNLNPLLIQFVSSDGNEIGRQNIENLVKLGFSLQSVQPNPQIAQKLSKASFLKYGNIHKYAEMALFAIPYRAAIALNIPLVFFGENPALEAGDKNEGEGWDATTILNNNTLGGHGYDIWLDADITHQDLIQYSFPNKPALESWGGKGIFMGYYLNWSGWKNGIYASRNGMSCHTAPYEDIGSHYKHNSLDSDFGGIVNAMLKYIKLGFGNTTEHASYDIRSGRITREEGAILAKALDGKCHNRYIEAYCEWIGISTCFFFQTIEKFRGSMWHQTESKNWELKLPIWEQLDLRHQVDYKQIIKKLSANMLAFEGPLL